MGLDTSNLKGALRVVRFQAAFLRRQRQLRLAITDPSQRDGSHGQELSGARRGYGQDLRRLLDAWWQRKDRSR